MRFLHLHSKHIKSSPLWWRLSCSNRRCAQTAYDQQGASGSLKAWTLRFPLNAHTQVTKSPTQSAQLIKPIANPVSWTPAIQKNQVSLGAGRWLMQLQCSNVNIKRNVIKCSPNTRCPRSRRHQQQEADLLPVMSGLRVLVLLTKWIFKLFHSQLCSPFSLLTFTTNVQESVYTYTLYY